LYRFNDICLSVKNNVCWSWLLCLQFWGKFTVKTICSYSVSFSVFSSSFSICFLLFPGSPQDRILTATFWGNCFLTEVESKFRPDFRTDMPKTSSDRLDFYLSGPTVRHISICLHYYDSYK
jgi:hypothetical protein